MKNEQVENEENENRMWNVSSVAVKTSWLDTSSALT